jgi:NADH:ubiquinone reductase (H+-translocating)
MNTLPRPRIIVIGAGFGGLNLVDRLAGSDVDVVLLDRTNHHLFQPLLYQVATAALSPADIATPIRSLFSGRANVDVQLNEVEGVDPAARTVSVRDAGALHYDYLVIATGASPSWFGHQAWERHSLGLKSLRDATRLREGLLGAFEQAESSDDASDISRLLTFVVVGGGPSGVELAGSIRELARSALARDFRRIRPDQARVVLFEGGPNLLAGFPERLSTYARSQLERLGVEVKTDTVVEAVDADGVVAGGQRVASANVGWCAGVAASPAARWLGVPAARHGRVKVEADCSVSGCADVFAIGDVAECLGRDGTPLPGVAAVAKQQGRYVAKVIAARIAGGKPPPPFRYRDQGSLAIVGRSAAVADLKFVRLTGMPAWMIWSCVHLLLLVGLRNRVLVYVQWVWAWVTYSRGARVIEGDSRDVAARSGRVGMTAGRRKAAVEG